jgi:hypothetical protein
MKTKEPREGYDDKLSSDRIGWHRENIVVINAYVSADISNGFPLPCKRNRGLLPAEELGVPSWEHWQVSTAERTWAEDGRALQVASPNRPNGFSKPDGIWVCEQSNTNWWWLYEQSDLRTVRQWIDLMETEFKGKCGNHVE